MTQGSPPRMRGKVMEYRRNILCDWITPAYAGKRHLILHPRFWLKDHPRVCGEKLISAISCLLVVGSPPRMRGKAWASTGARPLWGITPAYAGKRDCQGSGPPASRDHPRVCGEKGSCLWASEVEQGSPPRMRGKGRRSHRRSQGSGITPAYAGKSSAFPLLTATERDHPRVCGEKTKKIP